MNDENGNLTGYKTLVPIATGTYQQMSQRISGGFHELSFAWAGNMENKLFLGASINIPFSFYTKDITYSETDATQDTSNNFAYSVFSQHYYSAGIGVNVKLGIIYAPQPSIRLGFAVHTPSFMNFF